MIGQEYRVVGTNHSAMTVLVREGEFVLCSGEGAPLVMTEEIAHELAKVLSPQACRALAENSELRAQVQQLRDREVSMLGRSVQELRDQVEWQSETIERQRRALEQLRERMAEEDAVCSRIVEERDELLEKLKDRNAEIGELYDNLARLQEGPK